LCNVGLCSQAYTIGTDKNIQPTHGKNQSMGCVYEPSYGLSPSDKGNWHMSLSHIVDPFY